jgi:uncharacterized protein involved in outer membrane biogenesis
MKRVVKWIAGIVGLMVLSISALAAYVVLALDPNDYKQALTDVVKEKTDMDLALSGNLAWQLFPSIGISLGETSLKDPLLDETLVAVKQASVSVELMPLLRGMASVDAVELDGARVRFVQYADGKTSWDRLLEKLKSPEEDQPSEQVAFNIDILNITNTQLTLVDKAAGVTRSVDKIDVHATGIDPEKAFPLSASFTVTQADDAGQNVLVENSLNAVVSLNLEAQKPHIEDLMLNSALSGNMLPAPVSIALKAKSIDADIQAQQHVVSGMVLNVIYADPSRPAPISATINADIKADVAKGEVTISPLKLRTTVTDKALAKAVAVDLDTSVTANWKLGDISVPKLVARLDKIRLEANASLKLPALANGTATLTEGMRLSGKLSTNAFNPRDVMANLGITPPLTKDSKALSKVSLSLRISGDQSSVLAQDLRIVLDGSTISGEAGVRELPKARLYARLSLDKLNVDNYLPPETAATDKSPADKGQTTKAVEALLPVKLLREQNLDIGFKAGALTIVSYPITQLNLMATARDGLVNVSEFRGQVADGSFSVPATIDVRGKQPVISLKPSLTKIDLGPIAEKALKQDVFAGRMSFNGDVTVRGNSVDEWINSAKGPNSLRLNDGIIKGINIRDALFNALGQYQALLPALTGRDIDASKSKIGNTEIVSLLGDITLDQGVVRNESMKADLKDIQVGGSGTFNLQTNDVDYRFQLKLDKKYWGEKYAKMAEYAIPVRCNGNLQGSLTTLCGLDKAGMQSIVGQMAKARLNDEIAVGKGKLEEKLTEKLDPAQKEAVKQIFDLFKR